MYVHCHRDRGDIFKRHLKTPLFKVAFSNYLYTYFGALDVMTICSSLDIAYYAIFIYLFIIIIFTYILCFTLPLPTCYLICDLPLYLNTIYIMFYYKLYNVVISISEHNFYSGYIVLRLSLLVLLLLTLSGVFRRIMRSGHILGTCSVTRSSLKYRITQPRYHKQCSVISIFVAQFRIYNTQTKIYMLKILRVSY